jgi:hypothetical protein
MPDMQLLVRGKRSDMAMRTPVPLEKGNPHQTPYPSQTRQ